MSLPVCCTAEPKHPSSLLDDTSPPPPPSRQQQPQGGPPLPPTPPPPQPPRLRLCAPAPCPSDVLVSFLGTGSAMPSKHRSNSCILLQVPLPFTETGTEAESTAVVLDVGESACAQLFLVLRRCCRLLLTCVICVLIRLHNIYTSHRVFQEMLICGIKYCAPYL